ncbi:MAG: response regulator [Myxococcales bacterium]|nr:MAG: response regulator [Myxococcales bacterium]
MATNASGAPDSLSPASRARRGVGRYRAANVPEARRLVRALRRRGSEPRRLSSPPRPEPVTLANCDHEPIHIPGSIQSHGVLLAMEEPALRIRMASINTEERLGVAHEALLGRTLDCALTSESAALVADVCKRSTLRDHNPLKLVAANGGQVFDGILHRSGGLLVVELEPATSSDDLSFGQFYRRVRKSVARLRETQRVLDLAELAAEEVRSLTGFDRVMVYRFAPDASGEVVAESKRDGLESYLGLHYPASDIPAQARRLYTINWLRLIADLGYRPVPIQPTLNPLDEAPLDLSHSVLRSVSPIHVEYLTNMGVRASMSISLVVDEKLWGLVACHHYGPYFVPYEARAASEFLGEALSWQIAARERADTFEQRAASQRVLAKLVERMSASAHPTLDLAGPDSPLPALVSAEASAVSCGGKLASTGPVPSERALRAFIEWLPRVTTDQPFATESLKLDYPEAPDIQVAGVLVAPISSEEKHFVMWFRPEVERTINWGGNPEKTVQLRDGVPRLSPRGSFALWKETVKGHSAPWLPHDLEVAQQLRQGILGGIEQRAAELTKLNDELRASNFAKDEFLATVSHELRTPLNAMLGWLTLLESGELPVTKRAQALETVTRNARAQAQLVEDLLDVSRIISGKMRLDVQPVDPLEVVEAAIATMQPAAAAKGIRIQPILDPNAGPVMGDPSRLQQVLWNLLTNAVKFTPRDGRIQVRLQRVESSVELVVADSGSGIRAEFLPHAFDRFRQSNGAISRSHKGLGLGLSIVKHLVELHGGQVSVMSEGEGKGATFTVRLPIASLRPPALERKDSLSATRSGASAAPAMLEPRPELLGLRMLVVDDEPDARELVTTLLEGNGVEVTAAGSAEEALALLPRILPDILLSDIGMPKMDGYELLQKLRQLPAAEGGRTPAVALTAFARSEDRSRAFLAGFDMYLPKPVDPAELMALIMNLAQRIRGASDGERVTPTAAEQRPARVPAAALPLSDLRVLVVSGEGGTRAEIVRTLANAGALVSVAKGADDALRQLDAQDPDVLVCSLSLPDRSGAALLRELRLLNGHRTTPAVALTRADHPEDAKHAMLNGFQAYCPEAEAHSALVSRIAKLSAWSYRKASS